MGTGSVTRVAALASAPSSASGTVVSLRKNTSESGRNKPLPSESMISAPIRTVPPRAALASATALPGAISCDLVLTTRSM
jgi:hypothetical protein